MALYIAPASESLHLLFHESESESRSVVSNSLRPHGLCSPWNSLGQNTEVGSLSFLQGIFLTRGSNPGLPHCRQIFYQVNHKGSPRILEWAACSFSRGSSQPRNRTRQILYQLKPVPYFIAPSLSVLEPLFVSVTVQTGIDGKDSKYRSSPGRLFGEVMSWVVGRGSRAGLTPRPELGVFSLPHTESPWGPHSCLMSSALQLVLLGCTSCDSLNSPPQSGFHGVGIRHFPMGL